VGPFLTKVASGDEEIAQEHPHDGYEVCLQMGQDVREGNNKGRILD
jgi:hypothetical protein